MRYHKWFKAGALVALLFYYFAPAVGAAPVRWTFKDVRFYDGSPVNGWFIYTDAGVISDHEITTYTADGAIFHTYPSMADQYTIVSGGVWGSITFADCIECSDKTDYRLTLYIRGSIGPPSSSRVRNIEFMDETDGSVLREGDQGFITGAPVPIPPTLLLLGTGLIVLGWRRHRKRKR